MSSSVDEQLQQILDTVAVALRNVGERQQKDYQKQVQRESKKSEADGRKDAAQSGESRNEKMDVASGDQSKQNTPCSVEAGKKKESSDASDIQAVEALPIVVIRNFAGKAGSNREDLLNGLAQWVSKLAENQVIRFRPCGDSD